MATPSSDHAVSQTFSQFSKFPLEFIRLSLSDPELATPGEEKYPPWKHLFASVRSVPSLLQACAESRNVAKLFYTQGWQTKADGWGWGPSKRNYEFYPIDCELSDDLEFFGKKLWWRPESDVGASYGFYFDERVRFLVIPREVFEYGDEALCLNLPNLEIVFVMVDKPPKADKIMKEIGVTDDLIEREFKRWMKEQQLKWSDPISSGSFFSVADRYSTDENGLVLTVVTSLDEVSQIVAKQQPPAMKVNPWTFCCKEWILATDRRI
ncbi:uncharacterized protein PAC_15299 [Phialocephala subalpina]|uniref:Uncharacterized protein n=1 Tax=Phialocephala subalpina TaxID=576137 RepID=A0A1L7XK33_9HELO|nr:uncharacterized protein PAC_15299 [Phialocephala subalpina]